MRIQPILSCDLPAEERRISHSSAAFSPKIIERRKWVIFFIDCNACRSNLTPPSLAPKGGLKWYRRDPWKTSTRYRETRIDWFPWGERETPQGSSIPPNKWSEWFSVVALIAMATSPASWQRSSLIRGLIHGQTDRGTEGQRDVADASVQPRLGDSR